MGGYCGDGEPVECFSSKTVESRGVRKCTDCGRVIPRGTTYLYEKFRFDGAWCENVTCHDCEDVFEYLWDADAECLHHGGLKEYLCEMSPHDFAEGKEYADIPQDSPVVTRQFVELASYFGFVPPPKERA